MHIIKKKDSGIALVIVTVLLSLILGVVLGVVALNQAGARHANYFRDREIALTLAKAGVADALYRMNYRNYDPDTDPTTNDSGVFPSTSTLVAPYISESTPFANGSYKAYFTRNGDTNPITGNVVATDEITARGFSQNNFAEKIRTITVGIRGNNTGGTNSFGTADRLDSTTYGIAEAFNKHVIYADKVAGTGTTVEGNIAYKTSSSDPAGTDWTKTDIPNAQFEVPIPETPNNLPFEPATSLDEYQEVDIGGGVYEPRLNGITWPVTGVGYNSVTDTFTFDASYGRTNRIYVKASADTVVPNDGHATIDGATIQNFFKADGAITAQGNPTFSGVDTALNPLSGNITIDAGTTITGDLIVEGAALTLDNVTVNGSALCDNSITFSGTASTINVPDTSSREAAIILISTGVLTATITTAPTITFGTNPVNQKAAIILDSSTPGGNATLNLNNSITWDSSIPIDRRSAIVYTDSGKAEINVSSGFDGLLYANGAGPTAGTDYGEINLNIGTVNGTLVAGGTPGASNNINLAGGTLTWDKTNYTDTTDVFQGFSNGRRIYLPVIDSWREE